MRVCVGHMTPGAVLAADLPLKDLNVQSPNIKHFIDLVVNVPKDSIDIPQLQGLSETRLGKSYLMF